VAGCEEDDIASLARVYTSESMPTSLLMRMEYFMYRIWAVDF